MLHALRSLPSHFRTQPPLFFLSFLSGVCGIAYEIIYARILSIYLGDMFFVNAAILSVFLFMIGLGALVAHRFLKQLWLIEALIGVFALVAAYLQLSPEKWVLLLSGYATNPLDTLKIVAAIIGLPACMIGFSVPLFTLGLKQEAKGEVSDAFRSVYLAYHIGAALCVLLIEYIIFRTLGIRAALISLGVINLYIAWRLRPLLKDLMPLRKEGSAVKQLKPYAVIVLASLASGIFQLWVLKLSQRIFGPYHENFTIILVINLIGLAAGAYYSQRILPKAGMYMRYAAVLVLVFSINMTGWIYLWSYGNMLAQFFYMSWLLKLAWLIGFSIVPMTLLGSVIPVLLKQTDAGPRVPGHFLALSSFANVGGYLLTILVLNEALDDVQIVFVASLLMLAAGLILAWPPFKNVLEYGVVMVAAIMLLTKMWPQHLLSLGYTKLVFAVYLQEAKEKYESSEHFSRYDSHVDLVFTNQDSFHVNINGYSSLHVLLDGNMLHQEVLYGVLPSIYVEKPEKALVLGLGIGATAYGAGSTFAHSDVVEINPLMFDLQDRFLDINHGVAEWDNVDIHYQDGLSFLAQRDEQYDAIINTVTSPLFFSSSKLYTINFMEMAKKRLKPGGVYTLWFDARVTYEGQDIIQQTLKTVFQHCHFVHLNGGYTQAICSDSELKPDAKRIYQSQKGILDYYNDRDTGLPFDRLLNYLIFSKHALHSKEWGRRVNTYDLPALEYVMSAKSTNIGNYAVDLFERLEVDYAYSPEGKLSDIEQAERCFAFYLIGASECDERFEHGGKPFARYFDLLVAHVPNDAYLIDTAASYLEDFAKAERWNYLIRAAEAIYQFDAEEYEGIRFILATNYARALKAVGRDIPDHVQKTLDEKPEHESSEE